MPACGFVIVVSHVAASISQEATLMAPTALEGVRGQAYPLRVPQRAALLLCLALGVGRVVDSQHSFS